MGFFKKSPPKVLTSADLQIHIPPGWTVLAGSGRPIPTDGNGHQKNLQRLIATGISGGFPVELKHVDNDKTELSIHSSIGWLADVSEYVRPQWRKRAVEAAQNKCKIVGTCQVYSSKDGLRIRVELNRPNEIAIDVSELTGKSLTDSQIEKTLNSILALEELYPETVAGVRSQARKMVKLVASLYQHSLALDDVDMDETKGSLLNICEEMIAESEYSTDYDETQIDFEGFVTDWRDCVGKVGAYAPHVPSEFELADARKLEERPELAKLLVGKSIVLSGDFQKFTRLEGEASIKARGGKSPGSVSGKTFALVVGDKPGEKKQESALKLGIQQIDEIQFLNLLESGSLSH